MGAVDPKDISSFAVGDTDSSERIRTADLPAKTLWRSSFSGPSDGRVEWVPPTLETVSALMPECEILSLLGHGGMGAVYKARQRALDRLVAIKLLPPEVSSDEGYRRRFLREARLMAHLTHPRIVGLHEAGATATGGHLYITMEYVEGQTLHSLIQQRGITPRQTGRILGDICEGLAYAHAKGVVHRDIKPGNVMVDAEGRGKLADFGIARWSEVQLQDGTTGALFGTRDYLAPELLDRRECDHRVDIYALGVMLYEMLCFEVPRGHFVPPSQRIGTDRAVDRLVTKAMQQQPEMRYATVGEMAQALARVRWPHTGDAPLRRWAGIIGALVLAALAGVVVWEVSRSDERHGVPPVATPPGLSRALSAQQAAPPLRSTAARAPAAELAAAAPAEAGWHDWLAEQGGSSTHLVQSRAGYVPASEAAAQEFLTISPPLKNQALRITFEHATLSVRPNLRLAVRTTPNHDEYYAGIFHARSWQLIHHEPGGRDFAFQSVVKPSLTPEGVAQTLELRAIGQELTLLNDQEVVARAMHEGLAEGAISLSCGNGIRLLKVEWRSLEE